MPKNKSKNTMIKLEHSKHRFKFELSSRGHWISGTLTVITVKPNGKRRRYLKIHVHNHDYITPLSDLLIRKEYLPQLMEHFELTLNNMDSPMITVDTIKPKVIAAIDYEA